MEKGTNRDACCAIEDTAIILRFEYRCLAIFGTPQNLAHLKIIMTLWDKYDGGKIPE